MIVGIACVYLLNLSWRSVPYFWGKSRICHKTFVGQSREIVISIKSILNGHEIKSRTYLFILFYALGQPFRHNSYSCLCDLKCLTSGRHTQLALYFISPGGGLTRVYFINCCGTYMYICVKIQIVAWKGKSNNADFGYFVFVWCTYAFT